MQDARKHHRKPSSYSQPRNIGLLLGTIGLAAGTAWCLRNHFGTSSRLLPNRSSSAAAPRYRNWLLAALGAVLTGTAVRARKHKTGKTVAQYQGDDVKLTSHITIHRAPEEVYQYWKNFKNLPRVMSFIERVEPQEGNVYRWVARGPAGPAIEWDAEVVDDIPDKLLAWRSLEGSDIQTWGTVTFSRRAQNGGTDLSVVFNFSPPANATGAIARFMSGLEDAILQKNLRNLKTQMESGEISSVPRNTAGKETTTKGKLS